MNLLREGKREEHHRLLKLKRLVDGPSEKLDDLLGYLEENWNGIYGSRNLESKLGAKEVLVVGSGGIEKNIDLMLALPALQRQRDELESGWSPEPVEAQATEV